ncbi:MAG: DUF72 domain-containing protein [Deltaproteobacteria bacterium]|nr:DUF72 domain-containing protein [Deltaproteobacteria bacterium]
MAVLRIGTCSWKYESWAGLLYSAPKGINYLAEYARQFDTVEVDQWFWSLFPGNRVVLPDPRVVEEYVASVGPEFRFTVKAPNSLTLTHCYNKDKGAPLTPNPRFLSPALLADLLGRLSPMRAHLGALMLQFEYLNRQKMPSRREFAKRLDSFAAAIPGAVPVFVEVRNRNYFDGAFLDLLGRRGFGFVVLEGYYMPPVVDVFAAHREFFLSQKTVVIRLCGPDRGGMEEKTGKQWDRVVKSRRDDLKKITAVVTDLLARGVDVYLNVNNHYEGSAPLTIRTIRELLGA